MNLDDHLDHFGYRLLRDAMNEATAGYWLRRAEDFERARPRPGDYAGQATEVDIARRDARLREAAQACRAKAAAVRGCAA